MTHFVWWLCIYCVWQSLLSKTNHSGIGIVVETHGYLKSFATSTMIAVLLPEVYLCLQLLRKGRTFSRSRPGPKTRRSIHTCGVMLREKASPKNGLNLWVGEWLPTYPSMELTYPTLRTFGNQNHLQEISWVGIWDSSQGSFFGRRGKIHANIATPCRRRPLKQCNSS